MERQDDAEHHEEASGDDPCWGDYPRGRGYGQDYMRGGEVFGGYGYSQRPEYARPLAEQRAADDREPPEATINPATPTGIGEALIQASERSGDADAAETPEQRFPQDARAGDWDQPAPAVIDASTPKSALPHDGPPVPVIEGSYGTEGNRNRSRSYYLTQAQLQHRLEEPQPGTKRT